MKTYFSCPIPTGPSEDHKSNALGKHLGENVKESRK
jgi:hypothetical protein